MRNQMWAEAFDLLERADRLHRQFFRFERTASAPRWEPPVDVVETRDRLLVTVALPGVKAECIELAVEPAAIAVRAVRPAPIDGGTRIRHLEIPYGRFERRIPLPTSGGLCELESHEYVDGCLYVALVKRGERA